MTRELILHQVSAVDVGPLEFLKAAAAVGCKQVSMFTCVPAVLMAALKGQLHLPPPVTQETKRDVLKALADASITVDGIEFFPILTEIDLDEYKGGLALGRELGATRGVTHVIDTDKTRAVDNLGKVCDAAKAEGLSLGIEFTPTTPGCKTIQEGVWFVDQVGRANLGLGVDALHLIRGGGSAVDVAKVASRYIVNSQICDGHGLQATASYMEEVHNREMPGKGDFPLHDIFNAVPAVTPLEIEIPFANRQKKGIPLEQHLREAMTCSRTVVDGLKPVR
jgi:sugar phosphate isomerase/epimerase